MQPASQTGSHSDLVEATVKESASAAFSGVAASWRRSMLYHGLDPSQSRTLGQVSAHELKQAQDAVGNLLSIAQPTLDGLFRLAGQAGCCVVLTDDQGLILYSNTKPGDADSFRSWGLTEGAIWSEAVEGTNGIGTCLAEKAPVVIHQTQHFRAQNTDMSCMGAPIYAPDGEILAVLDVSSCRRDMDLAFAHVLGSVVTESARAVESDLFRSAFSGARILMAGEPGKAGVTLLAVDEDDLVIGATRQARKLYGLNDDTVAQRPPVADVLDLSEPLSAGGAARSDLRRALYRHGGNVSAAARALGISRATMYRRMKRYGLDQS
ncbi:regulatory Fis family protein [Roseibium hamelinense]|uniref:Regulatory Fis family protein n=1 Tax=Roseibium hamelinense TaxID=150831 RepID=A0A562SHJ2_9HYPH|nr:GAF domain-containing protein [Roseibium hamelinense]MTI43966.1 sigma-54-dependent Fis family transcriptional regulator [Roseibium hamelinense]TWI80739.1 regulatory Fis family protein [Roseibium hamelinense]